MLEDKVVMKPRIYVDTSVIGGCLDDEFSVHSLRLFDEFRSGRKRVVISDIVLFELDGAPKNVQQILSDMPDDSAEYVFLSEESAVLAEAYIREGVIAEKSLSDARHIAIATFERVDVLVSWNFKHIVNLNRIHLVNSVNLKMGYPLVEIRSPLEVIYEE
jgi:predicted nucleic acid-binding protein